MLVNLWGQRERTVFLLSKMKIKTSYEIVVVKIQDGNATIWHSLSQTTKNQQGRKLSLSSFFSGGVGMHPFNAFIHPDHVIFMFLLFQVISHIAGNFFLKSHSSSPHVRSRPGRCR